MFVRQLDVCVYIVNKAIKQDLKITKIWVKGIKALPQIPIFYPYIFITICRCKPLTLGCKGIGIKKKQKLWQRLNSLVPKSLTYELMDLKCKSNPE